MKSLESYRQLVENALNEYTKFDGPENLYDPMVYILGLGGKRLRPILTLAAAELFGGTAESALKAALAIEVFHNFTLVHDDIMDEAPIRRGKTTVHKKWDLNTGILSGDAMLIEAYRFLEDYPPELFKPLNSVFSKTAIEVCEGQQMDMDFERRSDVGIEEYLRMIELKTSVLVGCALKMGAMISDASEENQEAIYDFGRYLGIAFQLQDDFLDAFGNSEEFGKQTGGDITENKKTYLVLKALEQGNDSQKRELRKLYSIEDIDNSEKVAETLGLFKETGADKATRAAIEEYTQKAFQKLNNLHIDEDKKEFLRQFGNMLMNRTQ